jgi:hypothetical protein
MAADQKNIKFGCPHCGQGGEVVWSGDNENRTLVLLSDGFHVEEGRVPGAKHVIICDVCDQIDPPGLTEIEPHRGTHA